MLLKIVRNQNEDRINSKTKSVITVEMCKNNVQLL